MKQLLLFSTLGCHLCEHAKALVYPIADGFNYRLKEIDIADSDDLMARFGVKIPVLALWETTEENPSLATESDYSKMAEEIKILCWPFDADQVKALVLD